MVDYTMHCAQAWLVFYELVMSFQSLQEQRWEKLVEQRTGLVDWEAVRWQDGSGDRAVFERQQQCGGEIQSA